MRTSALAVALVLAVTLSGCAVHGPARPQVMDDDRIGADAANVAYVPGRGIVCATSAIISAAVMVVTFGHSYDDASLLMHGGCSGPWTVKADEIRNAVP
jgi:hypothetical protein